MLRARAACAHKGLGSKKLKSFRCVSQSFQEPEARTGFTFSTNSLGER